MQKGNSREEMAVAVQFTPEETQWWLDRLRIPKSVERFAANQFRHRAEVMRFVTEAGLVATRLFFRFAPRRQFDITDPRSTVGVVKKWCRDAGIGAATWKWLLHQQPEKPVIDLIGGAPLYDMGGMLNSVAQGLRSGASIMQERRIWDYLVMTPELFAPRRNRRGQNREDVQENPEAGQIMRENATGMLRALEKAWSSAKDDDTRNRIVGELPLVCDWLIMGMPKLDKQQRNAKWSAWVEKQAKWHEFYRGTQKEGAEGDWPARIGVVKLNGMVFTELNSKKAIKNEGIVMRHCLEHNSGETARRGQSIYFALTSGGKRTGRKDTHRATLEIAMNHEGQWRKRQLYGFGNNAVPEVVHTAADNLLAKINNQELLLNQDMEMSNTITM